MRTSRVLFQEYAVNLTAKAPSKKFPKQAAKKLFQSKQLPNGLQLAAVEDSQSPISSLAMILPTGIFLYKNHYKT